VRRACWQKLSRVHASHGLFFARSVA
jgi:hypothetical protein